MTNTNGSLLRVDGLKVYYPVKKGLLSRTAGYIRAVDGVSFEIRKGQRLGLVGESGCGKTTVARSIVRLVPTTAGEIVYKGTDVLSANKKRLRRIRQDVSLIFQDPFGSLNPRMTVGDIVGEPLRVQRAMKTAEAREKVAGLLREVGLPAEYMNRYPHEFSGGQRQRIGVARALATKPGLVICDEPVSTLDVSIQAQILNLLKDLQDEYGLTYLFIAHDPAVVEFFCDVVMVMYAGKVVEQAPAKQLYAKALHPYTRALLSSIPQVGASRREKRAAPGGEASGKADPLRGCPFYPRCPIAKPRCSRQMPALEEKQGRKHLTACWKC